jgi:hypothetical protein
VKIATPDEVVHLSAGTVERLSDPLYPDRQGAVELDRLCV